MENQIQIRVVSEIEGFYYLCETKVTIRAIRYAWIYSVQNQLIQNYGLYPVA